MQEDEFYFMFVHELAAELRQDAAAAFHQAGCAQRFREHFMGDIIEAMQAIERNTRRVS